MTRPLLTLLLLGSCLVSCRHAEAQRLKFDRISVEQGLSHPLVSRVMQDGEGFMWFGTADGLNRYDGSRFTVFRNDPADSSSLANNWIQQIIEDRSCDLWVATSGGGLNRFDRAREHFTRSMRTGRASCGSQR